MPKSNVPDKKKETIVFEKLKLETHRISLSQTIPSKKLRNKNEVFNISTLTYLLVYSHLL